MILTITRRVKLGLVEISESFIISSPLRTSTRLTSIYVKARHYKLSKAIPSISHIKQLLPSLHQTLLSTQDQSLDIFTNFLMKDKFFKLWKKLVLQEGYWIKQTRTLLIRKNQIESSLNFNYRSLTLRSLIIPLKYTKMHSTYKHLQLHAMP